MPSSINLAARRARRAEAQRDVAQHMRTALDAAGLEQRVLAEALDVDTTTVHRCLDPEHAQTFTLAHARGHRELAVIAARYILEPHEALVTVRPPGTEVVDDLRHSAALMGEAAEAVTACTTAIADGVITAQEAAAAEKELDELIQAALGMRERMRDARRNRGDGVRKGPVSVRPVAMDDREAV